MSLPPLFLPLILTMRCSAPYQFLLYVMAHEVRILLFPPSTSLTPLQLAHIKEMNHSWAFKQVNTHIRKELAALRAQGYYGDGFWSTGRALTSGRQEVAFEPDEQPVYTWLVLPRLFSSFRS